MNGLLVSFILALGISAWIYSKMMKTSGGLTQTALIVSGMSGAVIFFIVVSILSMLD